VSTSHDAPPGVVEGHYDATPRPMTGRESFRLFWPYARRDRWQLIGAGLMLVVSTGCETLGIALFGRIVDTSLSTGNLAAFWRPATLWVALEILSGLASFGGGYLSTWASERFLLRVRTEVFGHLLRLSPDFFGNSRTGDLISRLTSDIEAIDNLVATGLVTVFTTVTSVVFYAAAAVVLRWELALIAFASAPIFWLAARAFSTRIKSVTREERRIDGAVASVVEEGLTNVALVQAYNRQATEERRLRSEGNAWMRVTLAAHRMSGLYAPLVQFFETLCMLAIVGFGAWEISAHRITIGGLLAFAAFLGYLFPPLQGLGALTLTVTAATASSERINELLEQNPAVFDSAGAREMFGVRGHVEFAAVSFSYPGAERPALRGVSFTASPGEFVVITGASGTGKSTVAKLLLRFYDPQAGAITIDGHDIRDLALDNLRDHTTLLMQETLIFQGSVRDNIAYGRAWASEQDIEAAARMADAHDFVAELPDGYDTVIGQSGHGLSGGQRQRLAIARAMVRNAPVLVLDEPTTGLDAAATQRILGPLRRLIEGRTTIMITHDLELAREADTILVVDRGRIVERGTHEQLLRVEGQYARLCRAQTRMAPMAMFGVASPADRPVRAPSPHPATHPAAHPAAHQAPHPAAHLVDATRRPGHQVGTVRPPGAPPPHYRRAGFR
jgi:ATP-binding cassette subfamily B protein